DFSEVPAAGGLLGVELPAAGEGGDDVLGADDVDADGDQRLVLARVHGGDGDRAHAVAVGRGVGALGDLVAAAVERAAVEDADGRLGAEQGAEPGPVLLVGGADDRFGVVLRLLQVGVDEIAYQRAQDGDADDDQAGGAELDFPAGV